MLTLNDGRSELWQWDTKRKLTVDAECSQVHFSNKVFGRSIDVDVVEGVAIIPDVLLQTDKELTAWGFVGTAENGYTKISKTFKVNRKNKPADYVFTPTEQTTLKEILESIGDLSMLTTEDKSTLVAAVNEVLSKVGTGGGGGAVGVGIQSIEQTASSAEDGGVNTWRITLTDGSATDITLRNGSKGSQGAQGVAGPQGEAGPAGPQGPQGVPGNDYVLTHEDKTEIAEIAAGLVKVPEGGGNWVTLCEHELTEEATVSLTFDYTKDEYMLVILVPKMIASLSSQASSFLGGQGLMYYTPLGNTAYPQMTVLHSIRLGDAMQFQLRATVNGPTVPNPMTMAAGGTAVSGMFFSNRTTGLNIPASMPVGTKIYIYGR